MAAAKPSADTSSVEDHISAVASLSASLLSDLEMALQRISDINLTTHVISMNARVEAARAGSQGSGFAVIAEEMARLSREVSDETRRIGDRSTEVGKAMRSVVSRYVTEVRNGRLCELALVNIDLIDRNLYERSCDVRWWATDAAAVDCAQSPTPEARKHASHRLGQILDSYTVYFDLVLADLDGRIIANGRPNKFRSVGTDVSQRAWFRDALATTAGDQFAFETVHASDLVDGQRVLMYACTAREGGAINGRPVGVLGVVFNWDSLAQTIVNRTPLSAAEWRKTRVCVVDAVGNVLADSAKEGTKRIQFNGDKQLFAMSRGAVIAEIDGKPRCVAVAASPGYETYRTGWYSVIVQDV